LLKTQLLLQNQPERGVQSRPDAADLQGFQAEYRRARGIQEPINPAAQPLRTAPEPAGVQAQWQAVQSSLPKAVRPSAPPLATPPTPSGEAEIRRKILELRAAALKAQRKAEKSARQGHGASQARAYQRVVFHQRDIRLQAAAIA
jgi:hypothetical protein